MQTILKTFFNFIRRAPDGRDEERARFIAKSEDFRLLLAANNEALELMSEMTAKTGSGETFGMSRVRAQSLKTAAAVRQMIERLCRMAPGRHDALKDAFNRVVMDMETAMALPSAVAAGPMVLGLADVTADAINETGSKMALLGEIGSKLSIRVPMGFSITASAFRRFMNETGLEAEINRLIQISPSDDLGELRSLEQNIRHAIDMSPVPDEIEEAIERECDKLLASDANISLAVRSSALGEDSRDASFAGQFLSLLGVPPSEVTEAYRTVVASMYSATAMAYRLNRGLREDGVVMCVGCLEMVDAVAGGVVYTRNPVSPDDTAMTVIAAPGLPTAVVDGSVPCDTWELDRDTLAIRDAHIPVKESRTVVGPNRKVVRQKLDAEAASAPSLTDDVVVQLAQTGLRIEAHFGMPQDIEWALDSQGRISILQCRPLTGCRPTEAPLPASGEDEPFAILSGAGRASPGAAAGYIYTVRTDEDMLDFPDRAVLLVRNAKPKLSALLPRAAAVIAEHGSPAGHLANVAREYGIPALIGAPEAVDRLSGVSMVTVNGSTGVVYMGRRKGQLPEAAAPKTQPGKNEVTVALERILPFIVPLNLTDPASPEFAPDGCRTLHDITRYCHEKGVAEMFHPGGTPRTGARQLKGDLPMQYWLVDIGGGTAPSAEAAHITVRDIRSNAMRALWHGMTAVLWEGPPPVNAAGFMSVIAEASRNPALMPGMANDMGERNFFTVGKHYCNLQARFGFHFCTVEGFAGDDPTGNYVLFQYRGGGADMDRRSSRIRLVADILERQGFIAEASGDALYARIEGITAEAVEQALAVVGYLLVHTRQIDMAMTPDATRRYQAKFSTDIELVLSGLHAGAGGARQ